MEPLGNRTPVKSEFGTTPTTPSTPRSVEPLGNRTPVKAEFGTTPSTPQSVEPLGNRTPVKVEFATVPSTTTALPTTPRTVEPLELGGTHVKVEFATVPSSPPMLPLTPIAKKLKLDTPSSFKSPVSECSTATATPSRDDSDYIPSRDSASDESYVETPKKRKKPRFHFRPKTFYPKAEQKPKEPSSTSDSTSSKSNTSYDTSSGSEDEYKPYKPAMKKQPKVNKVKGMRGAHKKFMWSDSEEDESKMSAAQLQRKRNIEAQQEFLKKLDLEETKRELEDCFKPKRASNKPREVKPKVILPPREKSLRIQTIQKVQTFISSRAGKSQDVTPTLRMDEIMYHEFVAEDFTNYFVRLHTKLYDATVVKTADMDLKTCSLDEFDAKFSSLTLRNEQSLKVLPDPISAFAVHPSSNAMILGAGGKSGSLGFWNVDVEAGDWDESNIMVFLPHISNVTSLIFSAYDVNKVFSCSFDGTVRCGDLNKQTFELIYAEDDAMPLHWITQQYESKLFASKQKGDITGIDTRVPHTKQHIYKAHQSGNINTLSVNPRNRDQLLSCSDDKWLALWDSRYLSTRGTNSPLWQYHTSFPVSSAFFSGSGNRILATHDTELICIYETEGNKDLFTSWEVHRPAPQGRSNAIAKAVWHPQREDEFCVPNNKDGLDVYHCGYTTDPLHAARQSLHLPMMKRFSQAAFHPTLPAVVASCNHSLHLFL